MTDRDPAVEAAQRVWEPHWALPGSEGKLAAAAREALAPIRKLHRPSDDECHCCRHCLECGDIGTEWPCDTARLIYTTEELNNE